MNENKPLKRNIACTNKAFLNSASVNEPPRTDLMVAAALVTAFCAWLGSALTTTPKRPASDREWNTEDAVDEIPAFANPAATLQKA